jgi:hypothetical protein
MLQFSCDKTHCIDLRVCPHCEIRRLKEENQRYHEINSGLLDKGFELREEIRRLREALEKIENLARHHTDNPDWLRKEIVVRVRQALKGGDSE